MPGFDPFRNPSAFAVKDRAEQAQRLIDRHLADANALDLPSITRFVLKEVEARLAGEAVQPPFLRWSRGAHSLERLTS